MLESNTDRSYFMIGAVIVAAILIAGATFIFRDVIFGDSGFIDDLVTGVFDKANTMVGDIDTDDGLGGN
ncbi:hypothetical protein [Metabacillus sp. SLBN-84]